MIRIRVDAVLRVLDGFTGKPPAPSALLCMVDGEKYRPTVKDGGYYVLTGLAPGQHQVVLRGGCYQDERVDITVGRREALFETLVTMKPGPGYPFGGRVTRLTLRVGSKKGTLPHGRVWIAVRDPRLELRVAQDAIKAGEQTGRLFFPESVRSMALPCHVLLADGARSEVCRLEELEELEEGRFAAPLAFDHKRSCPLYPAQLYTADEAGIIRAVFREPLPVELLAEGTDKPVSLMLEPGDNGHELVLAKKK